MIRSGHGVAVAKIAAIMWMTRPRMATGRVGTPIKWSMGT